MTYPGGWRNLPPFPRHPRSPSCEATSSIRGRFFFCRRDFPGLPFAAASLAPQSGRGPTLPDPTFRSEAYPSTRSISSWWEWMPSLAYTCFTWAFTVLRDTTSASSM